MDAVFIALLLLPLAQAPADTGGPAAVQAGKALWEGADTACRNCHGGKGEGAFGPDLAGRQLSIEQFKQAVRKPWGIMPAFTDKNITDPQLVQLTAYLSSLPKVAEPGAWRTPVPANAPSGQATLIATSGCGQCHGAVLGNPRAVAGGVAGDFEWFKGMVYTHTTAMAERPHLNMGNFSKTRLPESVLQDIWHYASVDAGLRVPVRAQVSAAVPAGSGFTYTLTVENAGTPGKGLTAENITITLPVPAGATVATTTGAGYQGVRHDAQANVDTAVWVIPRLAPADKQTYTLTLSGSGANAGIMRGTVGWTKPAQGDGSADQVNVAQPPRPAQTQ